MIGEDRHKRRNINGGTLDSRTTELVMSMKFVRKHGFRLKKLERPIYMRNVDSIFNKEGSIEHTMKVNLYYKRYKERTEIDIVERKKWSVILGML